MMEMSLPFFSNAKTNSQTKKRRLYLCVKILVIISFTLNLVLKKNPRAQFDKDISVWIFLLFFT